MLMTFDYWIDEYMIFCRSNQLREKTLTSYEQTLRLFERWSIEAMKMYRWNTMKNGTVAERIWPF